MFASSGPNSARMGDSYRTPGNANMGPYIDPPQRQLDNFKSKVPPPNGGTMVVLVLAANSATPSSMGLLLVLHN